MKHIVFMSSLVLFKGVFPDPVLAPGATPGLDPFYDVPGQGQYPVSVPFPQLVGWYWRVRFWSVAWSVSFSPPPGASGPHTVSAAHSFVASASCASAALQEDVVAARRVVSLPTGFLDVGGSLPDRLSFTFSLFLGPNVLLGTDGLYYPHLGLDVVFDGDAVLVPYDFEGFSPSGFSASVDGIAVPLFSQFSPGAVSSFSAVCTPTYW